MCVCLSSWLSLIGIFSVCLCPLPRRPFWGWPAAAADLFFIFYFSFLHSFFLLFLCHQLLFLLFCLLYSISSILFVLFLLVHPILFLLFFSILSILFLCLYEVGQNRFMVCFKLYFCFIFQVRFKGLVWVYKLWSFPGLCKKYIYGRFRSTAGLYQVFTGARLNR